MGLVLSKIGMNYYETSVPAQAAWLLPFSANFFRCIVGILGFTLLLYYKEGFTPLKEALRDRVSMTTATTIIILPSYWLSHQPITLKGVLGAVISVVGVSLFFLL